MKSIVAFLLAFVIVVFLLAFVTACAAAPEDYEQIETGTVEQAITFIHAAGHGSVRINGNPVRCNHTPEQVNYSSSNPCIFPPRRNLNFKFPEGSSPEARGVVQQGMQKVFNLANARGWTLRFSSTGMPVDIDCDSPWLSGNDFGAFIHAVSNFGSKRAWTNPAIILDVCKIVEFATRPDDVGYMLENAIIHEMGHVLGFGHHNAPNPCHVSSMLNAGGNHICSDFAIRLFRPEELTMLSTFDVD